MQFAPFENPSIAELKAERDFLLRLLELGAHDRLEPFLEEALSLAIQVVNAEQGYLELRAEDSTDPDARWWLARGFTEKAVEDIRAETSRGIIAEALATGQTVHTASALSDPRFETRTSVRTHEVAAVLCAAVGRTPPIGVVYLQGARNGAPFSPSARRYAELFAKHLAPLATRLLPSASAQASHDPTRPFRARLALEGIVGRSAALARVFEQLALVAPLDVNVLITGPSGSGKSSLAQAIAINGPRATSPFVELNCAAIPEPLLESELFGAVRGAHSTATRDVEGKVALAEGGTLFLDEVTELTLASQAKLLHLIQTKRYFPLGAARERTANVRIIAATNANLAEAVAARRFREDLMYRLQVLPIALPPLSDRREDIPLLADHFAATACARHGLRPIRLSVACRSAAAASEWTGNARHLSNAVEAAVIRANGQGAEQVQVEHLFPEREGSAAERAGFSELTRQFQKQLVLSTLDATDWNVTEAARRLGLARSHVYNLLDAFGIRRS